MRSYLTTLNGTCGIFIHSRSDDPAVWKKTIREEEERKIIWTALIPGDPDRENSQNLEKIIQLIQGQLGQSILHGYDYTNSRYGG